MESLFFVTVSIHTQVHLPLCLPHGGGQEASGESVICCECIMMQIPTFFSSLSLRSLSTSRPSWSLKLRICRGRLREPRPLTLLLVHTRFSLLHSPIPHNYFRKPMRQRKFVRLLCARTVLGKRNSVLVSSGVCRGVPLSPIHPHPIIHPYLLYLILSYILHFTPPQYSRISDSRSTGRRSRD